MYIRIPFACECGKSPSRLREVGLTSDHQLVVYWRCSQCRKHVYIVKPLADYWRECPEHQSSSPQDAELKPEDTRFLRSVGIRMPDEQA